MKPFIPGAQPNAPRTDVFRIAQSLKEANPDCVVAVGGGSAIDSAKAIAMGVPLDGDVWDIFTGRAVLEKALPVGTILTIPAAGSEASTASVITNEDGWYKRGFNSDLIYPLFSILDPELCFTLPAYQAASGASDIMAHVMERYFTNTTHVEFTDRLCEATLKTVIEQIPLTLAEPRNYEAWAELMWAGTVAHNNLLNTGRVGDWGSHDIEHEVSAIYDVAHGAGLAAVFPAWMKHVYRRDIERFAQFAVRVWGVEPSFRSPERTALAGLRRLEEFYRSLGLPVTLKEMGVEEARLEEMADKCTDGGRKTVGNFVKLGRDDVLAILRLAYPSA